MIMLHCVKVYVVQWFTLQTSKIVFDIILLKQLQSAASKKSHILKFWHSKELLTSIELLQENLNEIR